MLSGCTSATCQYNSALHRASLLGLLLIVLCWMKRAEEQRKQRCTAVQEYPEQHLHHEQHLQPHGLHCQTKRRKKSTTFSRCLLRSVTEPHKSQRGCCFKVMSTNWLPFNPCTSSQSALNTARLLCFFCISDMNDAAQHLKQGHEATLPPPHWAA